MMQTLSPSIAFTSELTPVVGALATELYRTLQNEASALASWSLVERMLAYATEAEQRLAEQAQRIQQLEALSHTDELTGLLNRRGFDAALQRVIDGSHRYGESGVLALIDLDNFKHINDRYGHAAGDAVLAEAGRVLMQSVRSTDYVARLGGDEFALLYTRGDTMPMRARALDARARLNATVLKLGVRRIVIEASFGIVSFGPGIQPDKLMARADRMMYRDKRERALQRRSPVE